jgi:hypothetical protein
MVRLSIRSNFGVTFTQIHNMRETIVADATRPQQKRAFALAGWAASGCVPPHSQLMISALQGCGKQCTTAVDRMPALRQHAEQLMFARQSGDRGTQSRRN